MTQDNFIKEKCIVIVQRGSYYRSCRIIKNRTQRFGKKGEGQISMDLTNAIDHPFGSSFKLIKDSKKNFSLERCEEDFETLELGEESGIDNRDILDDGQSQSLTKSDIKQLVDSGATGDEVILKITSNSKTFKAKTKYSQEKYVNKKMKKYDDVIVLHRPSLRLLLHMYYVHDPLSISNLRIDSLSQMVSYVNVRSGGSYVVYEAGMQGLVSAAVLSQLGGSGSLVHVYSGAHPHREAVESMCFSHGELRCLSYIGADNLPEVDEKQETDSTMEINGDTEEGKIEVGADETRNGTSKDTETSQNPTDISQDTEVSNEMENYKARKFVRTRLEDIELSTKVLRQGVHGLVVACRQHPSSIAHELLTYLLPGHSFAVFSPYKETLMDLYMELKVKNCVNIRLVESWLRNYQVLPDRTHPEVTMSGGGGYLLTGFKVEK